MIVAYLCDTPDGLRRQKLKRQGASPPVSRFTHNVPLTGRLAPLRYHVEPHFRIVAAGRKPSGK
mgnify:CR=1 FL=1